MHIRRAIDSDVADIRRIHGAGISEVCSRDYPAEVIEAWLAGRRDDRYRQRLAEQSFWIGELEGAAIAFGSLDVEGGSIEALFLDPCQRNKGFAARLLSHLECVARDAGLGELRLASSRSAYAFYLRHAYKLSAGNGNLTLTSGVIVEGFAMHKTLSRDPLDPVSPR